MQIQTKTNSFWIPELGDFYIRKHIRICPQLWALDKFKPLIYTLITNEY